MPKIFGNAKPKLTNPLSNGEKVKRAKKQHAEILRRDMGMREPRSPV